MLGDIILFLWFDIIKLVPHHASYSKRSGDRLNIKMPSYQYRDPHVKDKTVSPTVLSLTWESPYLGKTVFILRQGPGDPFHYRDVTWASSRLKSPTDKLFVQQLVEAYIRRNIKVPHYWPFIRKFTGDKWISLTKDQYCGKCFHAMTLSIMYRTACWVITASQVYCHYCRLAR